MPRLLGWIALTLLVLWIGANPGPAADALRGLGDGVAAVAQRTGAFLTGSAG